LHHRGREADPVIGEEAPQYVAALLLSNKKRCLVALLIAPSGAMYMPPTGLVIPASKRGFWRRMAVSKVEPERGRSDMKWMPFAIAGLE
jgi:hypothetical protein